MPEEGHQIKALPNRDPMHGFFKTFSHSPIASCDLRVGDNKQAAIPNAQYCLPLDKWTASTSQILTSQSRTVFNQNEKSTEERGRPNWGPETVFLISSSNYTTDVAWLAGTKYIETNLKLILGSLSRTFVIQTDCTETVCKLCFWIRPNYTGGRLAGWLGPNMGIL